ncbi:MAG TPA: hypothetical protein VGI93_12165 [Steroidobacteraceae bacterium]|jgi:hypothetical protein
MADTEFRPDRDDTGGVQLLVAAVVVALDVVHVDGLGDAGDLIEVAEIAPEIGSASRFTGSQAGRPRAAIVIARR